MLLLKRLGLENVEGTWARAETLTDRPPFDFVVSRAVTQMAAFSGLGAAFDGRDQHTWFAQWRVYLKGGDLSTELAPVPETCGTSGPCLSVSKDPWFETKKLVHVAL